MSDDIAKLARDVIAAAKTMHDNASGGHYMVAEDMFGFETALEAYEEACQAVTPPGSGEDARINKIMSFIDMHDVEGWESIRAFINAEIAEAKASATAAERDRCADIADSMTEYGVTGRQIAQALRDTQGGE